MNSHTLLLDGSVNDRVDWCQHSCGHIEILDIVVGSERGKGHGRRLIEGVLSRIPSLPIRCTLVYAITRISNTVAHQFYEACGFRIVGRLHNFYKDRDDNRHEHALMYGRDV